MELLRACEPMLRREMYEAMRPHLRFPALPLEDYILGAKAHAEAAELPVMDEEGFLHPYSPGVVETEEVPPVALWAKCFKCAKESIFLGVHEGDAIHTMRNAGWGVRRVRAAGASVPGVSRCRGLIGAAPRATDRNPSRPNK